jgi:hypothetical protein
MCTTPRGQQWSSAGSTVVPLGNTTCTEIGPTVLRPDGSVFAGGGNGNTAFYSASGKWSAGLCCLGCNEKLKTRDDAAADIVDAPR